MPTATKQPVSAARSATARQNGAKSQGPKSAAGKAKSSQNSLKHGFSAANWLALPEDEVDAYEIFREELLEEMAPEGAMQRAYADQIVDNLWRLRRIMTMEADLVSHEENPQRTRTYEYVRYDWPQSHAALARYESSLHRNLEKARKALKELQNEPKPSQPGAPEPRASEPLPITQTIQTNTIELPIRSFEEQREYELIQVYLETHPTDTIFEAQKALYPKKYVR